MYYVKKKSETESLEMSVFLRFIEIRLVTGRWITTENVPTLDYL